MNLFFQSMIFVVSFISAYASSHCLHNGAEGVSNDEILEHTMDGDYGKAWTDWCEKTKSD